MTDRFAPIAHPLPLAHCAPNRIPAPCPQSIDSARAQPDYAAQDDMGAYAEQNRVRTAINDSDVANALDRLFYLGELSSELSGRIDQLAAEFCRLRLNDAGRNA